MCMHAYIHRRPLIMTYFPEHVNVTNVDFALISIDFLTAFLQSRVTIAHIQRQRETNQNFFNGTKVERYRHKETENRNFYRLELSAGIQRCKVAN